MRNDSVPRPKAEPKTAASDARRTELLAHQFWRARGCPEGSPDQDWFLAEEQLRHQHGLHLAQAA